MKGSALDIDQRLTEAGYTSHGWANGWDKIPEEINQCRDAGHPRDIVQLGRGGSEVTFSCDKCKLYWKVDMSD